MKIFFGFVILLLLSGCNESTKTAAAPVRKDSIGTGDSIGASKTKSRPDSSTAQVNDSIIPGKGIGSISIHQKTEEVIRLLGQPDSSDAAMGKSLLSWYAPAKAGDSIKHCTSVFTATNFGGKDEASRVQHIRINSPFFKTAENIHCGSTIAYIKAQYPGLKKPSAIYKDRLTGATVMIYDDVKKGIAFEIGEDTRCIGITVHPAGKRSWETYIAMFGEVKNN